MPTQLLAIDPTLYRPHVLAPAVASLAAGGIVAFPTETVYGLGVARQNEAAIARLRSLKDRPDAPFTLHIASVEQLASAVPAIEPLAQRLIERFWPGPLTLVLPVSGGDIGVRMVDARIAADLILQSGPLWATSANPRGGEPALDGKSVLAAFDGRIDWVIDGKCPGGPSTVARVSGRSIEILREGPITRAMLDRVAKTLVLFVCTGNTCRSPMAEALARTILARKLGVTPADLASRGVLIESAGTSAMQGDPPAAHAVRVASERGADLTSHRARPVSFELLLEAGLILTMTRAHRARLLESCPEVRERTFSLDPDADIADPVGGSIDDYRQAADQIERAIEQAIERFGLA